MLAEGAWALVRVEVIGREVRPDQPDHEAMHLLQLGHGQRLVAGPVSSTHSLLVVPLGRRGIGLDLQVLTQLLVADRPTLPEKGSNLLKDGRVALDGRRVVGLLVPDPAPGRVGLRGMRQAPDTLKISQAIVDGRTGGPATD